MERARFRRQAETSDAQLVPTRPAGVLSRAPGSVGNRSADIVSQIALSTTLIPKPGFLGAEPLSVFLVTFCTSKKLPHGVWALPLPGSSAAISSQLWQKVAAPGVRNLRPLPCPSSPHKISDFAGAPDGATGGILSGNPYKFSSSSIHREATASLGIRQSPRGLRATEPTLGPSGRQLRLNCWEKNRR